MNTKTIKMSKAEAKAKADAYRANLARRKDDEYVQTLSVYEALENGLSVINVGDAIRDAGFDALMRPKLAIARADRKQIRFRWRPDSDTAIFDGNSDLSRQYPQLTERINFNRRHGRTTSGGWGVFIDAYAMVPMIPADVRPVGSATNWHILWEVEEWKNSPEMTIPDRDPYLLRRLSGDLFVVLAEWDLTEVERMVMRGRANIRS